MSDSISKVADPAGPLVARASNEYRLKRLAIVVMLVGMGAYFGVDGWIRWPRENQQIIELTKEKEVARKADNNSKVVELEAQIKEMKQHSDTDLLMQKVLAFALPPMGLFVLGWALYYSRGAYRLQDNQLSVPGHPPIPLDAIRSIDRTDWDRKGIAWINYELPNGTARSACLDDFIYQRKPTDDIFKQIETYTGTGETPQSESETASA
ncbi:MAG: hypothetical protein JWN40_2171 [Phycisphaerales bacterium]|nr:hypothetical protein [Phycisphaerales bacterium]